MSIGRLIRTLDGLTRPIARREIASNSALRWAEDEKSLPMTERAIKHLSCAPFWDGESVRYVDVAKGVPLKIQIDAFQGQPDPKGPDVLDAECNNDVIIAGAGRGTSPGWALLDRQRFVDGRLTYYLELEGEGKGVIYAFDPITKAYGCMVDFCWGVGPGKYE